MVPNHTKKPVAERIYVLEKWNDDAAKWEIRGFSIYDFPVAGDNERAISYDLSDKNKIEQKGGE